jgi:hypothetical protein
LYKALEVLVQVPLFLQNHDVGGRVSGMMCWRALLYANAQNFATSDQLTSLQRPSE